MRTLRYLAAAGALVGLLVSLGYLAWRPVPAGPAAAEASFDPPRPAAEFTAPRLDGTTLSSADLKGDIVVLDFWATWCGPCLTEIPEYNRLHAEYRDRGVHIIGVTDPTSGTPEEVVEFASSEEHRIDYALVMSNEELAEAFGPIWGFPTTFLIGPDWQIYKTWLGANPRKPAELRALLDRLLEQRDRATAKAAE